MKIPRGLILLPLLLLLSLFAPRALAQGWVVAEGGGLSGSETYMHDLFTFMVQKSAKPTPKVAIIGAVPLEKDERVEAFKKAGSGDVTCLIITEENADSAEIYDQLSAADIIFIRGGDQGRYVNWWRGKKTEAAIKAVFQKGGVVSGSSAGCAIMGEWTYDAVKDGLSPREALTDAQHQNLTLTHGFLGLVPGVLFDTHFTERGRLPRTMVMLARINAFIDTAALPTMMRGITVSDEFINQLQTGLVHHGQQAVFDGRRRTLTISANIIAIGVDPRTAVCVGPDGIATVMGEGTATILSGGTATELRAGKPPAIHDMKCSQLTPGTRFNTRGGEILLDRPGFVKYAPAIETPTRHIVGPITIDGANLDDAKLGVQYVLNAERREAEKKEDAGDRRPDASLADGENKLPAVITTSAWRRRHPQWAFALSQQALASRPGMMAFFLDEGCRLEVESLGVVTVLASPDKPDEKPTEKPTENPAGRSGERQSAKPASCLILDSRRSRFTGVEAARPPRVHLEDAVVHLLAPGQTFDMAKGRVN